MNTLKKCAVLVIAVLFALSATLALAAEKKPEKAEKQWYIIKDKNGVCKVLQLKEKTDKTIAGPFKTKEEAKAAKEKSPDCAKPAPAKPAEKKPATPPGR